MISDVAHGALDSGTKKGCFLFRVSRQSIALHMFIMRLKVGSIRTSWINTLRVSGSSGIVRVGLFDTSVEGTSCRDSIGDVCFCSCGLDVYIASRGSGSDSVSFWFNYHHHETRSAANSSSF